MTDRRSFITALAALTAGGGATLATAAPPPQQSPASDAWLDKLKGKHKQLFDAPDPDGGTLLRHARGYLDVWRDAYGVPERDVNLVVTLYGRTMPLGLQDEMWAKYKFGEALNINDPTTNAPLARNWFAHPKPGDPVADGSPESAIDALLKRGVVFLLCNNAVQRWSGRLEKQGLGTAAGIYADLTSHVWPGVTIVPNVLIAMTKASERGFAYLRT
jgi:intracellular sulfur oxidation DsrE/DsrF family protein